MANSATTTDSLITLSASQLRRYTDEDLQDIEYYLDPSAILLTDVTNQAKERRIASTLQAPLIDSSEPSITELEQTTLLSVPRMDDAYSLLDQEYEPPVGIISSFIEQEYDPNTFETQLTGLSEYQELVRGRNDIATHLTTTMSAGQMIAQADIPLYGAGFIQSLEGASVPCITLGETPHVEELDCSKVGIQAIPDIGRKMRQQLEREGCINRRDIIQMNPTEFLELDGFGPYYAARVTAGACAIEQERPLRFVPDPIADERRVYVDIETDSLSPRYIWQIGVYDDDQDQYHCFINDDTPGSESGVVEEFAEWVATNGRDATFIAWYGKKFDFVHLTDFINRHAPEPHQEIWDDVDKFDLLLDFVKSGVATPARSHKLDVVADRLGYEREYPGLSGEQAAQAYVEWTSGGEMDWEMWISYCEDDVIAMKYVYDMISNAEMYVDKRELERAYRSSSSSSQLDDWDGS